MGIELYINFLTKSDYVNTLIRNVFLGKTG